MATKIITSPFEAEFPKESVGEVLRRKVMQADALSSMLVGDGFSSFQNYNDDIQEGVLSLLCDLIRAAQLAMECDDHAKLHADVEART